MKIKHPHDMMQGQFNKHNRQPEKEGLFNPESKETCLMLWLLSSDSEVIQQLNFN